MKNIHEVAKQTGKSFQEVYNIVKNLKNGFWFKNIRWFKKIN
jgi:hypothetical protein